MKALLISIHTEHALNILKGDKILELRKSVPKGFVGWVYGYVTKGGEILYDGKKTYLGHGDYDETSWILNGTIPFRFWFEEYEILETTKTIQKISETEVTFADGKTHRQTIRMVKDVNYTNAKGSCLTDEQLKNYGKGKDLYAWHIKKLEVFDKPMELGEFYRLEPEIMYNNQEGVAFKHGGYVYNKLRKAPQSYQYVWVKGESNE